jgi:ribonuclease D
MNLLEPLATLAPPILVTALEELKDLADRLLAEPVIAVDTESNSLFAYRERVCLVQFSTTETDYLVDPLEVEDLTPLGPVFASESVEKIFHAAEYDVICLRRDYGFRFNHLFDTMVACRILGRPFVGLGDLLQSEFAIVHDKRFQRANWGQRPLSEELIDYARLDTHYLIPLRERLVRDLESRHLLPLAEEDFTRLASLEGNGRSQEVKPVEWWQVRGANELDPAQAGILQELCRYRETVARASDRPLFKVINDHTLVAIAETSPRTLSQLSHVPGMTRGQVNRHGQQILKAVQQGKKVKAQPPQHPPRPNEAYQERMERLRRWRKETAEKRGVPSDVVMPKDILEALAGRAPATMQELGEVMELFPWRLEQFGEQILIVINQ